MIESYKHVILDGNWVARRAFAVGGQQAMIEAFVSTVIALDLMFLPLRTCVVWEGYGDGKTRSFRRRINPDYKGKRKPPPDEFVDTLSVLYELLPLFNVPQFWPQTDDNNELGEADDIAYTLVHDSHLAGPFLLVSADKDWLQMVDEFVHVVRTTSPRVEDVIHPENIVEKTGLDSAGWSTFLTVAGDTADGVPGLPRVGKKRGTDIARACPHMVDMILHDKSEQVLQLFEATAPELLQYVLCAVNDPGRVRRMWEQIALRFVRFSSEEGRPDLQMAVDKLNSLGATSVARKAERLMLVSDYFDPL
jgi:5'-3' exonuclease